MQNLIIGVPNEIGHSALMAVASQYGMAHVIGDYNDHAWIASIPSAMDIAELATLANASGYKLLATLNGGFDFRRIH